MPKDGEIVLTIRMPEKMHNTLGHIRVDTKTSLNKMIIEAVDAFIQSYNMIQKAKRRKRG